MNNSGNRVILLGASSFVGVCVMDLLSQENFQVLAFSRQAFRRNSKSENSHVEWRKISILDRLSVSNEDKIKYCICVAPVWVLQEHFKLLEAYGVQRVIALSSTSRFTKNDSSDQSEKIIAKRLIDGETQFQEWAEKNSVDWTILRPTLIYGMGRDKNVNEIARFAQRFGFFPVFGKAEGKRQPIHAQDVAAMCFAALNLSKAINREYNIAGGEILSYREMVRRVFEAIHRKPRMLTIPLFVFRMALVFLHLFPKYWHWSVAMAERMNNDQVFDSSEAISDLGISPRGFQLMPEDIQKL